MKNPDWENDVSLEEVRKQAGHRAWTPPTLPLIAKRLRLPKSQASISASGRPSQSPSQDKTPSAVYATLLLRAQMSEAVRLGPQSWLWH